MNAGHTCGGHAGGHGALADELRAYAGGALDVLEPLVERIRTQEPDPAHPEPASCTGCPVCAVVTVLRGGRSELAVRLAEQVSGLLTVLRTALDEGVGGPAGPTPETPGPETPGPEAPAPETPAPETSAQPPASDRPTASVPAGPPRDAEPAAPVPDAPARAAAPPRRESRTHPGRRVQRIAVDHGDRWLTAAGQTEQC